MNNQKSRDKDAWIVIVQAVSPSPSLSLSLYTTCIYRLMFCINIYVLYRHGAFECYLQVTHELNREGAKAHNIIII